MKRVLVVEDEPVIRALIAASLAGDCEVAAVTDGHQALESLSRQLPDLVLLDLGLPGMSGGEVLRRLRADAATAAVPVIFLTGAEPPANADADGVLRKPFTPALLRESVFDWLS